MKGANLKIPMTQKGNSLGFSRSLRIFLGILLFNGTNSIGGEAWSLEVHERQPGFLERDKEKREIQSEFRFQYEPQSRRDPFMPLDFSKQHDGDSNLSLEHPRTKRPNVKLLGIMSGLKGYYATIQNPDGKRYIVTLGNVIASEGLKVKDISERELVFEYFDPRKGAQPTEGSYRYKLTF